MKKIIAENSKKMNDLLINIRNLHLIFYELRNKIYIKVDINCSTRIWYALRIRCVMQGLLMVSSIYYLKNTGVHISVLHFDPFETPHF